jgi:hypothetical protein
MHMLSGDFAEMLNYATIRNLIVFSLLRYYDGGDLKKNEMKTVVARVGDV